MPRTRSDTYTASGRGRSTWRPASTGGRPFYHSTGRTTPSARWEGPRMTLSRKIAAAVDACAAGGTLPCDVVAEEGPHRLSLRIRSAGPVGLAFEALDFAVGDRPEWSA